MKATIEPVHCYQIHIVIEHPFLNVRSEVFMVVIMKNAVFWEVRCVALVRTDISEENISSQHASVASHY
jgi:hypothetical protein